MNRGLEAVPLEEQEEGAEASLLATVETRALFGGMMKKIRKRYVFVYSLGFEICRGERDESWVCIECIYI